MHNFVLTSVSVNALSTTVSPAFTTKCGGGLLTTESRNINLTRTSMLHGGHDCCIRSGLHMRDMRGNVFQKFHNVFHSP